MRLAVLALLFLVTSTLADDTRILPVPNAPEFQAFLKAYLHALNTKDVRQLKALIHPQSQSAMRSDNIWYSSKFDRRPIPSNCHVFVYDVDPYVPLPFAQVASVPFRPTHKFQISWDLSPDEEASIVGWLVNENGHWLEVLPDSASLPPKK